MRKLATPELFELELAQRELGEFALPVNGAVASFSSNLLCYQIECRLRAAADAWRYALTVDEIRDWLSKSARRNMR